MRPARLLQPVAIGTGEAAGTDLSLYFEGLASPTRLKIVERLAGDVEVTVSELALRCRVSQPRMSWHLRILRRAGIITTRRDGREVLCRLDRDTIASRLEGFNQLLSQAPTAAGRDRAPAVGIDQPEPFRGAS